MISNRKNYFVSRPVFSAVVIVVALLAAPTLQAGPAQEAQATVYAQLTKDQTDPTLRYPVTIHVGPALGGKVSRGWLEISREMVRYQPVMSYGTQGQEFEERREALTAIKYTNGAVELQVAGKKRRIHYEPADKWGKEMQGMTVAETKAFFKTSYAGSAEIQKAIENFDTELRDVRAGLKGSSQNARP